MTIREMEHVGIVVEDLAAARTFFTELGLIAGKEEKAEGSSVDRILDLNGVSAVTLFLRTPDGHGQVELVKYSSPPAEAGEPAAPANTLGLRHLTFVVDRIQDTLDRVSASGATLVGDVEDYEGRASVCYLRGPEGVLIQLVELKD
jgi:catechol 2,3-dioxygenase-like lactoylglutathione lyase family enzyme